VNAQGHLLNAQGHLLNAQGHLFTINAEKKTEVSTDTKTHKKPDLIFGFL